MENNYMIIYSLNIFLLIPLLQIDTEFISLLNHLSLFLLDALHFCQQNIFLGKKNNSCSLFISPIPLVALLIHNVVCCCNCLLL